MTAWFISGGAVVDIDENWKRLSKAATRVFSSLSSCIVSIEIILHNRSEGFEWWPLTFQTRNGQRSAARARLREMHRPFNGTLQLLRAEYATRK